jgi:hypothetical protein
MHVFNPKTGQAQAFDSNRASAHCFFSRTKERRTIPPATLLLLSAAVQCCSSRGSIQAG